MAKKISRPAFKKPAKADEQKPVNKGGKTYDDTNRGVLFQNDKEDNEKRPDLTGHIIIELPKGFEAGDKVKFFLSGWEKESQKDGKPFVSLTIKVADAKYQK